MGIDPDNGREEYQAVRTICPTSWIREAEEEVLAKKHPTMVRDGFKKEVVMKMLSNYEQLREDKLAHMVSLSSQTDHTYGKIIREYFTFIFTELNTLPDATILNIDLYPKAAELISGFLLTDNTRDIMVLQRDDGAINDILVTSSSKKIMGKLREMGAQSSMTRRLLANDAATLDLPDNIRVVGQEIPMDKSRFEDAVKQPWIAANVRPNPLAVKPDEVKMRPGSVLQSRMWVLILHVYTTFQEHMANHQTRVSGEWERSYFAKAIKEEEERKRATQIFTLVQFLLGNRETICSYHRTYDGNDHKNVNCNFNPRHLHTWKCYETTELIEDDSRR